MIEALHLRCPPLEAWLPARLGAHARRPKIRTLFFERPSRAVEALFVDWPPLRLELPGAERPDRLDGLIVVDRVGGEVGRGLALGAYLEPGAWVVEIVELRGGGLHWLLGYGGSRARERAAVRAAHRVIGWSLLGLFDLQQWRADEPSDAVVTLGRLRG